jgi:hypothetical protein
LIAADPYTGSDPGVVGCSLLGPVVALSPGAGRGTEESYTLRRQIQRKGGLEMRCRKWIHMMIRLYWK